MNPGTIPLDLNDNSELPTLEQLLPNHSNNNNEILPTLDIEQPLLITVRNECRKCKAWKPIASHHCSICKRCIMKLDHHCVWVNNCIAMYNQKVFLLFLWYTFWMCIYSGTFIILQFLHCTKHETIIYHPCDGTVVSVILIAFNFMEAIIFALFTCIMFFDQIGSIFDNTPYIDMIQGKKGVKRGKMELLNEVFGEPLSWRWLIPFAPTAKSILYFVNAHINFSVF